MELMYALAGIGMVAGIINHFLKASNKPEQAIWVDLAALVASLMMVNGEIRDCLDAARSLFDV